jgi:hypothetical protein
MSAAKEAESRIVRYLDALEREQTPSPIDTLEVITLQPGMSVAVIGNGSLCSFIQAAAGDESPVFMVENDSNLLEEMRHLSNGGHKFHVVVIANPSAAEITDWVAVLREVTLVLREHGRLIVIESSQSPELNPPVQVTFHEMIRLLEHNSWNIHRHGATGPHRYVLEATVTDQSVQS